MTRESWAVDAPTLKVSILSFCLAPRACRCARISSADSVKSCSAEVLDYQFATHHTSIRHAGLALRNVESTALFGRAPKGAPTPRGALPNGVEHDNSVGEAGGGAAKGFHWGGGATKTWLHPALPPLLLLCRGRPEVGTARGGAGC
jgi:hypothetical protein